MLLSMGYTRKIALQSENHFKCPAGFTNHILFTSNIQDAVMGNNVYRPNTPFPLSRLGPQL